MKLLKKPFFAVLLCILLVLCSTLISANIKLSNACTKVVDGFYDGMQYQGETQEGIAADLKELCAVTEDMIVIANNYGIKTADVNTQCQALKAALNARNQDIANVYSIYSQFYSLMKTLENDLHSTGLSQRHTTTMSEYSQQLSAIKTAIDSSGYNESVTVFLEKNDRFPENMVAELVNVQFPAHFA